MNLINFVRKEPNRARLLIIILSVALLTTASALIVAGAAFAYVRRQEKETAASLTAADILSLRQAYENADAESVRILMSLVACRISCFLNSADADTLVKLISVQDNAFFDFCGEIDGLIKNDELSAEKFALALRGVQRAGETGVLSRAAEIRRAEKMFQVNFRSKTADKQASEFLGLMNIFSAEGNCAFCQNLYIEFIGSSNSVRRYAIQYEVDTVRLSEEDCVSIAKEYASSRHGIEVNRVSDVTLKNGVFFVILTDKKESNHFVGVRGDTGEIVFFLL